MPAASPVGHGYHQAFTSESVNAAWDAWLAHVDRYQQRPSLPVKGKSQWQQRAVESISASLPFLANIPAARSEAANIWREALAGNTVAAQNGASRLTKTIGNSVKASQSFGDALFELFMAQERYHQARIEAAYKEAEAEQEYNRLGLHDDLNDAVRKQIYDNLLQEMTANMIISYNEVCRRIIENF